MNRAGVFAIVAAGAALGSIAGAAAVGKKKHGPRMRQQPYAAVGSGLLATGAAAVLYKAPVCPPCGAGLVPTGPVTGPTSLSHGGYGAAVAFASILGGVIGAMAVGKQKPSKLLGQQPYAPIGAALLGAGAAAVFYPTPPTCPPCVAATATIPPGSPPIAASPLPTGSPVIR